VHLHPERTKHLPTQEVAAILRGADDLIASGGRTLLVKVLRGSRDKKILELKLEQSPVYGCFRELSNEEVLAKIDWLISHQLLRYEYEGRLPVLVYTEKGWEIERVTYANELFKTITEAVLKEASDFDMSFLKDKNRQVIFLLLDMVQASRDARFIPLLESWEKLDYKKVRQRIRNVINSLGDRKTIPP
jgi:superfamily II DNA helicase RecQ